MTNETSNNDRMFEELQELVAMEVKDIFATASEEGFKVRDVVSALEMALQAEIAALAEHSDGPAEAKDEVLSFDKTG